MLLAITSTHVSDYSVMPQMAAVLIVTTVRISNLITGNDKDQIYSYKEMLQLLSIAKSSSLLCFGFNVK
jgi:hypothetical protein